MSTEIRNSILTTDKDAQYDECAKRVLSQKSILAHILVKTVDEFKGMNSKDVISYIEGEPFINIIPVEPGLTNGIIEKNGERIGLSEELPGHEEKYELHRLLGALLSQNLTVDEKLDIIGNEYEIPIEKDFREDVSVMCNLSQKIKETGIETGIEIGIERGKREMIMKMHGKGYTITQIADVAGMNEKKIEDIIKNAELLPV